jgi:hypothetical protein
MSETRGMLLIQQQLQEAHASTSKDPEIPQKMRAMKKGQTTKRLQYGITADTLLATDAGQNDE